MCHGSRDFGHGQRRFAAGFQPLVKPDMSLDYGKLVWAVAKSPGKIGGLIRLQKQTKFAAGKLAAVLEKITFS